MSFLRRNRAAVITLAVAVLFLVLGVLREETQIVFRKAVNICMECISEDTVHLDSCRTRTTVIS